MDLINPLSANPTKWSNTLKQFVAFCLSVFDYFVGLAPKGLRTIQVLPPGATAASLPRWFVKYLNWKILKFLIKHLRGSYFFISEAFLGAL